MAVVFPANAAKVPLQSPEQLTASAPLLVVPARKKRAELDEDWQDSPAPKRRSVNISPDLDGSRRPRHAPVMVACIFAIMAGLGLLVVGLMVGGSFVLANKIHKLDVAKPWSIDDCLKRMVAPQIETRVQAVEWLQNQPVHETKRRIVVISVTNCCLTETDRRSRLAGINVLRTWWVIENREDAQVINVLIKATADADQEVAQSARDVLVQSIQRLKGPKAIGIAGMDLVNVLGAEDAVLRQAAANALSTEGGPEAYQLVTIYYPQFDTEGRQTALQVLKNLDPQMVKTNKFMKDQAKRGVVTLQRAVNNYALNEKRWPATLQEVCEPSPVRQFKYALTRDLLDPWGRPFEYEPDTRHPNTNMPLIYSHGPPGMNKPIRNWEI